MGFKRRKPPEPEELPPFVPFMGFSIPVAKEIYEELSKTWISSKSLSKFVTYLGQELRKRGEG